jgi:hypothetical protein
MPDGGEGRSRLDRRPEDWRRRAAQPCGSATEQPESGPRGSAARTLMATRRTRDQRFELLPGVKELRTVTTGESWWSSPSVRSPTRSGTSGPRRGEERTRRGALGKDVGGLLRPGSTPNSRMVAGYRLRPDTWRREAARVAVWKPSTADEAARLGCTRRAVQRKLTLIRREWCQEIP